MTCPPPIDAVVVAEAASVVAKATDTTRICVTRAENGAALWDNGELVAALAPHVVVKDTVGAYVASHHGATPLLPPEIFKAFKIA